MRKRGDALWDKRPTSPAICIARPSGRVHLEKQSSKAESERGATEPVGRSLWCPDRPFPPLPLSETRITPSPCFARSRKLSVSAKMPYPLFTQQHLKHGTPSRSDGLTERKEAKLRHSYCRLLEATARALKLPPYVVSTAIFLAHQFYMVRSMKRNDRFLVATAALYLACKIEDPVRNVMDIVHHAYMIRYKREPERVKAFRESPGQQAKLRELVLEAETRILYVTGFDFFIDQPYSHVFRLLKALELSTDNPEIRMAMRLIWTLINDSRRSTLWLQYSAKVLAAGLMVLAFRHQKIEVDWTPLWKHIGGEEAKNAVGDVCSQMLGLYGVGDLHACVSQQDSSRPLG